MSTVKKLTRAERQQIEAAIVKANRTDKKEKSAQDSIPYQRMWPDGICRVTNTHYTKTIQYQDINYQLSQNEDKTAIFEGAFRFAVFPKRLISFNPMQYVVWRGKKDDYALFSDEGGDVSTIPTLTHETYLKLEDFLKAKNNPALLPIQIAYYTGLRIGEVCGLTWQDINLDEQYLTVRRSMRYNNARHKTEIGATKRRKVRTVDFCDTLAEILRKAKLEQHKNRIQYGELYSLNYYTEVKEKDRSYYEVYSLPRNEKVTEGYKEIFFVCLRPDGAYESPSTIGIMCKRASKKVEGLEGFHFHQLRHTFTSNLLSNGAAPKDVQELLGHSDVSTTMNVYAHASREAKRTSARLLDKVVSG